MYRGFAAGKRVEEDTIIDDCKDKLSWFVKAFFSQADSLLGGMSLEENGLECFLNSLSRSVPE